VAKLKRKSGEVEEKVAKLGKKGKVEEKVAKLKRKSGEVEQKVVNLNKKS
jgi:hypothetical protein